MTQLVEFPVDEGGSILMEVDAPPRGPVTRGRGAEAAVTQAGESLERALGRIGPAVKGIVDELRSAAEWPDEVTVEFSVKVSADANVIIARSTGEANFKIALKWTRDHG